MMASFSCGGTESHCCFSYDAAFFLVPNSHIATLHRAKAYFLLNRLDQALEDSIKACILAQKWPEVSLTFFHNGACNDCTISKSVLLSSTFFRTRVGRWFCVFIAGQSSEAACHLIEKFLESELLKLIQK